METLLTEIAAFCQHHEMSKWDFGELAMNDRPFVKQLEDGRDIRASTAAKLRAFMAEYEQGRGA